MRKNNGVTLVSLVITLVVLAIITSVGVVAGINITGKAKFENLETSLLLIQSKAKVLADKKVIGEIDNVYGEKQEDGEYAGWYKLSQSNLDEMGLKDLKESDDYYVFYAIGDGEKDKDLDVAYGKGMEFEGTKFYKLSEILKYTNK